MQSIKKELDQLFLEEKWQEIKNLTSHYSNKQRHSEPSILLYAGIAEIETGNVHTGQKKIEQYLEKSRLKDAVAYFYLGRAFDLNKKSLLADDFYNKAIKIDPQKTSYKIFKMVNLFNNSLFEEIKEIAKSDFEQWKSLDLFPLVIMTAYEQTSNEDQIPYEIIELCTRFAGQVGDQKTIKKYIDFLAKNRKAEKNS